MKTLKELYNQSYKLDEIIFHIPHSSSLIPEYTGYSNLEDIQSEINIVTDWYTEEIFNIKNISKIITPYSRVFCDVERLPDEVESMEYIGRGFFYTKTLNKKQFRKDKGNLKEYIKENYYDKHHAQLNNLVKDKLTRNEKVLIIDCHSFNEVPIHSDKIKDMPRPDICIGNSVIKTPIHLTNYFEYFFLENEYYTEINNPYEGTIIPSEYLEDFRVHSILIEINKELYMNYDYSRKENKVTELNELISNLIFNIFA